MMDECARQVAEQWARNTPPHRGAAPAASAVDLHVAVEGAEAMLWRMEHVLEAAEMGVTSPRTRAVLLRQRGWQWNLGKYMQERLNPVGPGPSLRTTVQRPDDAHPESLPSICLDFSSLADGMLHAGVEGRSGLRHALENLGFAQFQAGGPAAFWGLVAEDDPVWGGKSALRGKEEATNFLHVRARGRCRAGCARSCSASAAGSLTRPYAPRAQLPRP
jgi:hypothetical protein